jgi:hypothetical protein
MRRLMSGRLDPSKTWYIHDHVYPIIGLKVTVFDIFDRFHKDVKPENIEVQDPVMVLGGMGSPLTYIRTLTGIPNEIAAEFKDIIESFRFNDFTVAWRIDFINRVIKDPFNTSPRDVVVLTPYNLTTNESVDNFYNPLHLHETTGLKSDTRKTITPY